LIRLVYKLKRIKSFFTGLENEPKSNERRVISLGKILSSCYVHDLKIYKNVDRYVYMKEKHRAYIEQHEKYTKDTLSKNIQEFHPQPRNPSHFSSQFYVKISFTYFSFLLRSRKKTSTLTNNIDRAWEKISCYVHKCVRRRRRC
jgi:hypothetical protein